MLISFKCPACGQMLTVDEAQAGATGECPKCKTVITAPSASPQQPPSAPSAVTHTPAAVCDGCGAALPSGARFCPGCGQPTVAAGPNTATATPTRELVRPPANDESGFIYVMVNASMDGLVKIGKTKRDPSARARELSAATGVPTPFAVAYEAFFSDCSQAEQYVHAVLEDQGYRLSSNKEFFAVPPAVAVNAVVRAALACEGNAAESDAPDELDLDDLDADDGPDAPPWQHLLDEASDHRYGSDDTLEDPAEAIRLFQCAARMGSAEACLELGQMYHNGEGVNESDSRALQWFKEGARRGSEECYAEMGLLYMSQDHHENARKCWDRYFSSESFRRGGPTRARYGWGYCRYVTGGTLPTAHKGVLYGVRDEIAAMGRSLLEDIPEEITDDETAEFAAWMRQRFRAVCELLRLDPNAVA